MNVIHLLLAAVLSTATYWTVHIDIPSDRAEYERIDREDAEARRDFYSAHNLSLPTVWKIVTSDGAYFGLRPRGTLADLDKPSITPELAKELQAKTNPISERIHKTLRTHHSEIWRLQQELSTRADNPMPRKYSMMRTDFVAPPKDAAYETGMKELVRELAMNGVETLAFFASYGDGAYHYIFSSEKPIKVRKLSGLADTRDVAISRVEIH
jgi:hypothetical protein